MKQTYWHRGQVGLAVLLILVTMVTVGVSVATRSVSELKLSRQEQESTQALNAAEAGIEAALAGDLTAGSCSLSFPCTETVNGLDVHYYVEPLGEIQNVTILPGHTLDAEVNGSGSIMITWTRSGTACNDAALVIAKLTATSVTREAKDPCSSGFPGFDNSGIGSGAGVYTYTTSVAGVDWVRIKTARANTTLSVSGAGLVTQAYRVNSRAEMADGTTRVVEVTQLANQMPSIFDYALFSGDEIIKD